MIIRTKHMFKAGKAESKIECKWVNQVDAEAQNASMQRTSAEANSPGACAAASDSFGGTAGAEDGRAERERQERESDSQRWGVDLGG